VALATLVFVAPPALVAVAASVDYNVAATVRLVRDLSQYDQYLAVVLPGRMFKAEFARRGLAPRLLSRTIGDSGTVTAPLVPRNSCAAFMSATPGVFVLAYLPFAFFNLLTRLTTIVAAFLLGHTMASRPEPAAQPRA
jgi:NhaC family Na+:H+ antiporter